MKIEINILMDDQEIGLGIIADVEIDENGNVISVSGTENINEHIKTAIHELRAETGQFEPV